MSYIAELIDSNSKSISEMLKSAIALGKVSVKEIRDTLQLETSPVAEGGDIYNLHEETLKLLSRLQDTPDRDMLIIVKKIFRSTKYAAITWYTVTGADNNPHHLPIQPFSPQTAE